MSVKFKVSITVTIENKKEDNDELSIKNNFSYENNLYLDDTDIKSDEIIDSKTSELFDDALYHIGFFAGMYDTMDEDKIRSMVSSIEKSKTFINKKDDQTS